MLVKKSAILAVLMVTFGLAGCATTATDPDLANRVSALEQAVAAAEAKADGALSIAQRAEKTATMALGTARNAQACCEANGEKMNRMFEKASSK